MICSKEVGCPYCGCVNRLRTTFNPLLYVDKMLVKNEVAICQTIDDGAIHKSSKNVGCGRKFVVEFRVKTTAKAIRVEGE